MQTSEYQIKMTGEFSPNVTRETALTSFSQLFKLPIEQAERTFSSAPVVLKKGIDQQTAEKFRQALERIGVVSLVEPFGVAPVAMAAAEAAPPERSAPVPSTPVSSSTPVAPRPVAMSAADQPGFPYKIEGAPDYAFLTVQIPAGQTLKVEASAMATMDTNIRMKTKMKGGFSRLLTSESIFINEFTAENGPGEIGIAPGAPGDLGHVYLNGDVIFLQNSAFVASGMDVAIETKWQGLTKGFFSGESLFLIRASGTGNLWFNTYGGMIELDVDGDYVVDTGNIVAFTDGLEYRITKVSGYKSLFFSGEGFVCRFSGKGKVWIQTRTVQAFASWVHPFRPVKKNG